MANSKLWKIWAVLLLLGLSTTVVACGGPGNQPAENVNQQDDDQPGVQNQGGDDGDDDGDGDGDDGDGDGDGDND